MTMQNTIKSVNIENEDNIKLINKKKVYDFIKSHQDDINYMK